MDYIREEILKRYSGYATDKVKDGCSIAEIYRLHKHGSPVLYAKVHPRTNDHELIHEAETLKWLADKVTVPQFVELFKSATHTYLMMNELPGKPTHTKTIMADRYALVDHLVAGMKKIHAIPIQGCPLNQHLDKKLTLAAQRILRDEVKRDEFSDEFEGRLPVDLLFELMATKPYREDLVFTHGDYCLPNILLAEEGSLGFLDLGRAGISDRYQDIALAMRSLRYNLGEAYDPDIEEYFIRAYGLRTLDRPKCYYYRMLDELF